MDILHTFEVYQKQLENIQKNNFYGRPQVLKQFRMQFKGFNDADVATLKIFLSDNQKKWFVAHLLDNLDTFPSELLKPMLEAAVDEPNPSFNNEFIKPCRRVFDYVEIQKILMGLFHSGNSSQKIGVLNALYWARPTVFILTVLNGSKTLQKKGFSTFFWDYELKSFNEDFKEDEEVFIRESTRQEDAYKEQLRALISEFYQTDNMELKYCIALRLPKDIKDFPSDLKEQAEKFLKDKKYEGIPKNIIELDKVKTVNSSFFRRVILFATGIFTK
jgi:hypothetical protein